MNDQNTQKLFDRFDFFHPEKPLTEGLMAFGFECRDGWFDIIWRLCEDIEKLNPPEEFEVNQVKEKFGTLRFYCDNSNKKILQRILEAEKETRVTCEMCGRTGKLQNQSGFYMVRCNKCFKTNK